MYDPANDPLLSDYLVAHCDAEADAALVTLLDLITPVVERVVRGRYGASLSADDGSMRNATAQEVVAEARAALLTALVALRADDRRPPIANVLGYVTQVARHACAEEARRRARPRMHLKNRVRYYLTTRDRLALWVDAHGDAVAGLASDRARRSPASSADVLECAGRALAALPRSTDARSLAAQIEALIGAFGEPMHLDDLVTALAAHIGLVDDGPEGGHDGLDGLMPASTEASALDRLEGRSELERTWTEILALPVRQRHALLLGLRAPGGGDGVALLAATGVATLHDVAAALELPVRDVAALVPRLPLDDATIGARLGLARQQVINLRKAARARLTRRLVSTRGVA